MAKKSFEIQGAKLRLGGLDLEAGTTSVVIPGVTQAATYFVEEVEDTDIDQTTSFIISPIVIDAPTYNDYDTNGTSTGRAEYICEMDNEYIDKIELADGGGSYAVGDIISADMWAYVGVESNPFTVFTPSDWVEIPFRPVFRAAQVEYDNIYSSNDISIGAGANTYWTFGTDGGLTFPDNTVQSTAFTGNADTVTNGVYTSGSYNDPSWLTLTAEKVGLNNVTNESKATMFTSPTFTGTVTAVATAGTVSTTSAGLGYIGMPQNSKATSYTLVAGDQGKHIYVTAAGQTVTVPSNETTAFPIGTTIAIIAGPTANPVSIAITSDTMYLGGVGSTGTRTLTAYGMATLVKVAATTWFINGSGLS